MENLRLKISALFLPAFCVLTSALAAPAPAEPIKAAPLAAAPLAATVNKHSLNFTHTAADYLDLTQAYLDFCRRLEKEKQPAPELTVRDGLAAVDAGESSNSKFTDWPKLRAELEAFLKKPEPPPEQKKDQQKQDQQKQDQQKQDQKNQSSDPQQSQQNQPKPEPSKDQQNQSSPEKSDPNSAQPKDQNSAEPPKENPPQNQKPQQSAFGDMKQPEKPADPNQSAQPSEQTPEQPEMQQVGGSPTDAKKQSPPTDPNLVIPLQKLDQIRQKDSPAQLQQILQGPAKPQPPGKNW